MKYKIIDKLGFKTIGTITIKGGIVTETDHELRYMKGWITASVEEYSKRNSWRLTEDTSSV